MSSSIDTELKRCQALVHQGGCHIIVDGKNSESCRFCDISLCNPRKQFTAVAQKKRFVSLDTDYGWVEKDDLYLTWNDTQIFFAMISQTVPGTTSEKIMQHLVYEKDGIYPGLLVIVTNDDNIYCERQFQYYKRKGGKNVFFVWESRLPQLIKKLARCRENNLDLKDTSRVLNVYRSKFMTTRLKLSEFKLLAKYRQVERLQKKGLTMVEINGKHHSVEVEKKVSSYMTKLEKVWKERAGKTEK